MEEDFFFWYHLNSPPWQTRQLRPYEKKWFVARFLRQKETEAKEYQSKMKKK